MKQAKRSFHQACYQYAAEWPGTQLDVSIDGQSFASVTAVALRDDAGPDQLIGTVAGYELTLFSAGGAWRQYLFSRAGAVISETIGGPAKLPRISIGKER